MSELQDAMTIFCNNLRFNLCFGVILFIGRTNMYPLPFLSIVYFFPVKGCVWCDDSVVVNKRFLSLSCLSVP
jgi:hypothetical protein